MAASYIYKLIQLTNYKPSRDLFSGNPQMLTMSPWCVSVYLECPNPPAHENNDLIQLLWMIRKEKGKTNCE